MPRPGVLHAVEFLRAKWRAKVAGGTKGGEMLLKALRGVMVLALLFLVFASGRAVKAQDAKPIRIGFSIEAMNGERWQTDLESFEARAKQLGAQVVSSDAHGDDDLQFKQVKDMIQTGIQVLVLLPHDEIKASRIVDAAKAG